MLTEPMARFELWWTERKTLDKSEAAHAMVVSSVDDRGRPSSRVVLLRGFDERGFVFYTNLESRKGRELLAHPFAALNFHWPPVAHAPEVPQRQVRVEGRVERVSDAEADAYFASRARDSQLGAWASDQSRALDDARTLFARVEAMRAKFEGKPVPRPPHWSGLRIVPDAIELWHEGAFRLHTRERYERTSPPAAPATWTRTLLFP